VKAQPCVSDRPRRLCGTPTANRSTRLLCATQRATQLKFLSPVEKDSKDLIKILCSARAAKLHVSNSAMYPVRIGSFDGKCLKLQILQWSICELHCHHPAWIVDVLNCNPIGMLPVPIALRRVPFLGSIKFVTHGKLNYLSPASQSSIFVQMSAIRKAVWDGVLPLLAGMDFP